MLQNLATNTFLLDRVFSLVGVSPSLLGLRTADWLRGKAGVQENLQGPSEHESWPLSSSPPPTSQQPCRWLLKSAPPICLHFLLLLPSELQSLFLV